MTQAGIKRSHDKTSINTEQMFDIICGMQNLDIKGRKVHKMNTNIKDKEIKYMKLHSSDVLL